MNISREKTEKFDYYGYYTIDWWVGESSAVKGLRYTASTSQFNADEAKTLFESIESRLASGLLESRS